MPHCSFTPSMVVGMAPSGFRVALQVALPKAVPPGPQANTDLRGLGELSSSPFRTIKPSGSPVKGKKSALIPPKAPVWATASETVLRPLSVSSASIVGRPISASALTSEDLELNRIA